LRFSPRRGAVALLTTSVLLAPSVAGAAEETEAYAPLEHHCEPGNDSLPCVGVSGRVVDVEGNAVPGVWVEAWFTTDHYAADTFHPEPGDPALSASADVPRCYKTSRDHSPGSFAVRDAVLTDAEGRYVLPNLYRGEQYWIVSRAADFDYSFSVPGYWQTVLNLFDCPFRTSLPYSSNGRAFYEDTHLPDFEVLRRDDHVAETYALSRFRWKRAASSKWVVHLPTYHVWSDADFGDTRISIWVGKHRWHDHSQWAAPTQGSLPESDLGSGAKVVSTRCGYVSSGGRWLPARSVRVRLISGAVVAEQTFPIDTAACR